MPDRLMEAVTALASNKRVVENRAHDLFEAGQFESASLLFEEVLAAEPESARARVNLAASEMRRGHFHRARPLLEQAVQLDPESARAHYTLGALLARLGEDSRAFAEYRAALKINSQDPDAQFNAANALRRLERYSESLRHYRAVLALDPGFAPAHYSYALVLQKMKRWQEAVDALEEAHLILPRDRVLTSALVRALAASPLDGVRNGERALVLANQLVAADPAPGNKQALAMALAEVGRFEEAVAMQAEVVRAAETSEQPRAAANARKAMEGYERRRPSRLP